MAVFEIDNFVAATASCAMVFLFFSLADFSELLEELIINCRPVLFYAKATPLSVILKRPAP